MHEQNVIPERRGAPRSPFDGEILVASFQEGGVPPADQFESFCARDVSRLGLSFHSTRKFKKSQLLIIGASQAAEMVYLIAKVTGVRWSPSGDFVIACQLTGRVASDQ